MRREINDEVMIRVIHKLRVNSLRNKADRIETLFDSLHQHMAIQIVGILLRLSNKPTRDIHGNPEGIEDYIVDKESNTESLLSNFDGPEQLNDKELDKWFTEDWDDSSSDESDSDDSEIENDESFLSSSESDEIMVELEDEICNKLENFETTSSKSDKRLLSTNIVENIEYPSMHPLGVAFLYQKGVMNLYEMREGIKLAPEIIGKIEIVKEIEVTRALLMSFHGVEWPGIIALKIDEEIGLPGFLPNSDRLSFLHSTPKSLNNILCHVCKYSTQKFRIDLLCQEMVGLGTSTPDAFQYAIIQEMKKIECYIHDLEEMIQSPGCGIPVLQGENCKPVPTLMYISNQLDKFSQVLECLYDCMIDMKKNVLDLQLHRKNKRFISCTILQILYNHLDNAMLVGTLSDLNSRFPSPQNLLMHIFMETLCPFVRTIGDFIYRGELCDISQEFFIRGNENQEFSSNDDAIAWFHGLLQDEEYTPNFFTKDAEKVLLCGKSIRLLLKISSSNLKMENIKMKSLENIFKQDICKETDFVSPQILLGKSLSCHILEQCNIVNRELLKEVIENRGLLRWLNDLRAVFLIQNETLMLGFMHDLFILSDERGSGDPEHTMRIPKTIFETMEPSEELDNLLTKLLQNDISSNQECGGCDPLEAMTSENVSVKFIGKSSSISSDLNTSRRSTSSNYASRSPEIIDCVQIYCEIPTPLNIIIDSEAIRLYQSVFKFLLHVKRSNHELNQLQHRLRRISLSFGCTTNEITLKLHKLCLMLCEQRHFVGNIHDYAMQRVIGVSWNEFVQKLQEAKGLDELREIHNTYIRQVCAQCLLSPQNPERMTPVMDAVIDILASSGKFRAITNRLLYHLNDKAYESYFFDTSTWRKLDSIQKRFKTTQRFLKTLLSRRVAAGGVPHLEYILSRLSEFNGEL